MLQLLSRLVYGFYERRLEADVRRGHGSQRIRYPLLSLPLYLVERLPRMVESLAARI